MREWARERHPRIADATEVVRALLPAHPTFSEGMPLLRAHATLVRTPLGDDLRADP